MFPMYYSAGVAGNAKYNKTKKQTKKKKKKKKKKHDRCHMIR